MKKYFLFLLSCLVANPLLKAQKTVLLETKCYSFQSNLKLNAHLYLYNRAMGCKYKKVHQDSLAYYSFKDKIKLITPADQKSLNAVVLFYRDSLVSRDLLFDSLMRDLGDHLSKETLPKTGWQLSALEQLKKFEPHFNKLYWKGIDADNKAWVAANKEQLLRQELFVIPDLQRIYQVKLPSARITIDLTCYATWAGAFSYYDTYTHVIFASTHGSNKGDLATEVVFHETSHFLVDKVMKKIAVLSKGKDLKQTVDLWHNMIFYTTGYVMEKYYAGEHKMFIPYYVQMKFEEKFPAFKLCVDACKENWLPYCLGTKDMDEALKAIVDYVGEKK